MESHSQKVSRKLNTFINKIIFLGKNNIFEFKGLKLYPSEIHLILVMSEAPTNASQMAKTLNVTKGAVSQTISRLEKKGILIKNKDPYLKNEITLAFTPLGNEVFQKYRQISRAVEDEFINKIENFREDELFIIGKFMDEILQLADTIHKIRNNP